MFWSKQNEENQPDKEQKVERTVLSHKFSGGPHGIGDPDDKTLRKVELDALIPKIIRERSRKEKCVQEVKEFEKCCKASSFLMVVKCRKENKVLLGCLEEWWNNNEFRQECRDIYLKERSEYRRTGLTKKVREAMKQNEHA